jgi:hypothetical protein
VAGMEDKLFFFFLPMIVFLGAVTGYEDIKHGKIRNKWIMLSIVYTAIAYLFAIAYYSSFGFTVEFSYFREYLLMVFFTVIVAFVMWWACFWTAGDGKLFIAFSVLVPLSVYRYGNIPFMSSTNLLINTMVPFFLFYAAVIAVRTSWRHKASSFRKLLQPRRLMVLALFLFGFTYLVNIFFSFFGLPSNFFFVVFVLFFLLLIIDRIFGQRIFLALAMLSLVRIAFDRTLLDPGMWVSFAGTYLLFLFLVFYVLYLGYDYMSRVVDIALLKPGMVPAQIIYKQNEKYIREDILHVSLLSYMYEKTIKREYILEPRSEGLTQDDIDRILSEKDKLEFEHVRVFKTLHFAPFLFVGTLLTILFQGNLFISLVQVIP